MARRPCDGDRRGNPARGSTQDHVDGPVQNGLVRDDASGRLHHVEVPMDGPLQASQISNDERLHVCVERRRRGSLELAELGEHFVARGDRHATQRLRESPLMRRIEEREEERDRDGLGPARSNAPGDRLEVAFRRGAKDPASRVHALPQAEAPFSRNRRRRSRDPEVVEGWPILTTDEQQVLEALRRHERGAGALPLQDRVRRHGGSVRHPRRDKGPHPLEDRRGWISRARQL